MKTIQVGIIGTGGMGARHARNLAEYVAGAEVAAVMDIDHARAEAVAAAFGGAKVFTDGLDLIRDAAVDAVVIVSPDPTHSALAIACLVAGKPVLCEKPLATNLADAEEVLRLEMAKGRRLVQVGLMREFDPAHRTVKDVIEKGEIGRPLFFRGLHTNLGSGFERTIEDVIINSVIHDIHSARWFIEDEVESVYVQPIAANPQHPESCRFALIQMTFKNGSLGVIEMNADAGYGYEVIVEVVGERGSARTTGLQSAVIRRSGTRSQTVEPDWLVRFDTAYIKEVQAWVRSLQEGKPVGANTWDGYISLLIADACVQSAKTGQPQTLPVMERPALYERS